MSNGFLPKEIRALTEEPTGVTHRWIGHDFLFCLFPSYLFFLLGFIRYYRIRHLGHSKVEPHFKPYFYIKYLCLGMSGTYVLRFFVAYWNPEYLNIDPHYDYYIFLYIFPIISWYWSYWLTLMQLKRKLFPEQIEQFLFWVLSSLTMFITTVFEEKNYKIEFLIDFIQFGMNTAIVYYYYHNEFEFLRFIEEIEAKHQLLEPLSLNRPSRPRTIEPRMSGGVFITHEPSIYEIPILEIKFSRKIHRRVNPTGEMEAYFRFTITAEGETYEKKERSLTEFIKLEQDVKLVYSLAKFDDRGLHIPSLDEEIIDNFLAHSYQSDQLTLIEHLEEYINIVARNPLLMSDLVLDFLSLPNHLRQKFSKFYYEAEQRKSSGRALPSYRRVEMEMEKLELRRSPSKKFIDLEALQSIRIEIRKGDYTLARKNRILYHFRVEIWEKDKLKNEWEIAKTFRSFLRNHHRIRNDLPKSANLISYKEFIPDVGEEERGEEYISHLLDGFEKYLKTLVSIKKFRCQALFNFIEFDPESLKHGELWSVETYA